MAIKRTPEQSEAGSLKLIFDNGDLQVLNLVKEKWSFRDDESALRFALAILLKAENKSISIKDESGGDISVKPSDELLLKK